jgi:hypothetical protein
MRKDIPTYICNNVQEVQAATANLCLAHEVPLQLIDGGVVKDVTNFKGVYNSTKGEFCAAVTDGYNVITHQTYFNGFAEAMDRLNIKYKMGIREQGNQAFADIDFVGRNIKFDKLNEEFLTGIRLTNSYNKVQGIGVIPRFTRLACTNGMILTRMEKTFSIRHHSKMAIEIESFIELKLNNIINKDEQLQMWISESMADSIEWKSVTLILEKMFSQAKHREEILKRLGITVIEKKKGHKVIGYSYVCEDADIKKLDRWKIYNSITDYITHGAHITPNLEQSLHRQAEKILTTTYERLPIAIEVKV